MTPQEQELIQNVANKLKASPNSSKDADAERLIAQEIASQNDVVYKLTQAVLIQEMALKELQSKSEFLEQQVAHYKSESERSTFSRMMGGSNPAPVPPAPVEQPSAFGSFMKTAAGVAVGVVAGSLIADALFGDDEAAQAVEAASDAVEQSVASAGETAAAAGEAITASAGETVAAAGETITASASETVAAAEETTSSFLSNNAGFASEFSAPEPSTIASAGFAEEEDLEEEI